MDIAALYHSIQPCYPELKGQVVIVTGSARGIGKGIALRLARERMKVVVHGHIQAETDATAAQLIGLGAEVLAVTANFRQEAEVYRVFDETMQTFGKLNLLVNNAAELGRGKLFDVGLPLLEGEMNVNIKAPYLCSYRAAEIMRAAGGGGIINISSVGGLRAHWRGLPYDMTKGAMDAMTRAMALELSGFNIRVNAIAPGLILKDDVVYNREAGWEAAVTKRIPLARTGNPQDIAAGVAFLASSQASYITGQVIYIDGGITAQLSPPGQDIYHTKN
jgi:NAD(P)-dependent dehydrogenase (short-subunit alcohol dehydrogenase family)